MAAMIPGVSQPEIQRQVRQQRADIDALYELVERVDQKVRRPGETRRGACRRPA